MTARKGTHRFEEAIECVPYDTKNGVIVCAAPQIHWLWSFSVETVGAARVDVDERRDGATLSINAHK